MFTCQMHGTTDFLVKKCLLAEKEKNSKNQLTLSLSFDCNEAAYGRLSQKCNKLKS